MLSLTLLYKIKIEAIYIFMLLLLVVSIFGLNDSSNKYIRCIVVDVGCFFLKLDLSQPSTKNK